MSNNIFIFAYYLQLNYLDMLKTFETIIGQSVKLTELYDYLELAKSQYSRFVKKDVLQNPYFEMNKDYLTEMSNNKKEGERGQFRQEINIHIDAAKKLCMVSKSKKGNEIRNELVELTKKVENKELVTEEEVVALSYLNGFFSYVENQKCIRDLHADKFAESENSKYAYANFHKWRNDMLNIDKEHIELLIKQYCIDNKKIMPKINSMHDKIRFLNEYDSLRNAIWDFLSIRGEINALKLSNLAKKMAAASNLTILNKNETNLFQSTKELPAVEILIKTKELK